MKYVIIIILIVGAGFAGYKFLEEQKRKQYEMELAKERQIKEAKEAAFKKAFNDWYEPPKSCQKELSGPLRTFCINDRIRRRKEFRQIYKPEEQPAP